MLKNKPILGIILLLSVVSTFFACSTTQQTSTQDRPLITQGKKAVIGAYCEVALPPEEVKITIKTDSKNGKSISDDGETYYFFLGHVSKHPAIPFYFTATDEWYLVVSKDPKTQEDLKKMTVQQTGLLAVAEIPPLTEFYQSLIQQLPESMKSRLSALNLYKVYQCFGYQIVDKALEKDEAPLKNRAGANSSSGMPDVPRR